MSKSLNKTLLLPALRCVRLNTLLLLPLILSSAFLISTAHAQKKCLKIASANTYPRIEKVMEAGMKKVFKDADLCFSIVQLPIPRIKQELIKGRIDGELVREIRYVTTMKDYVINVPTAIVGAKGVVITLRKSKYLPSGVNDLVGRRIGGIKQVRWHQIIQKKIKTVDYSLTLETQIKKLKAGRVEGILIDEGSLDALLKKGTLQPNEIHRSFPIIDLAGYFILHKSKKHLIEKIDRSIRKIKKQGDFDLRKRPSQITTSPDGKDLKLF